MKWEETSVIHLIPPLTEQGEMKKGVQDCVKWTSEHLQGWTLHNLPGKLVPLFSHAYGKIDLTSKPNFFQSMSLASSLFTGHCCEDPGCPSSLLPCHQVIIHMYEASLSLLLSRLENPNSLMWRYTGQHSQPLLVPQIFQSFHQLFSLFLGSLTPISPVLLSLYLHQADVASPLLSRGRTHVLTTICQISLSFTKVSNQSGPGLWAHISFQVQLH